MITYLIDIIYKTDYSLSDYKYEDGEEYESMFEKADEFFNEFISRESVIERLAKDGLTVDEVINNRDNYFIVSVVPPDDVETDKINDIENELNDTDEQSLV